MNVLSGVESDISHTAAQVQTLTVLLKDLKQSKMGIRDGIP